MEYPGTGNFYERVDLPHGITWDQANSEAEGRSYLGFGGQLMTITDSEEQQFLNDHLSAGRPDPGRPRYLSCKGGSS